MVVRIQLALGALIMLAGVVWGVVGETVGPPFKYWGFEDGHRNVVKGLACSWCENQQYQP